MADWPESERPVAFMYEEVNYPEGMFHIKQNTSKKRQGEAGKKVYQRFVKGKSTLNKYQHHMIRDMATLKRYLMKCLMIKKQRSKLLKGLKKEEKQ